MADLMNFFRALKLLWSKSDQLLRLLGDLPSALNRFGAGMEAAGEGAIAASYVLKGNGRVPINARQVVEAAAAAIEECKQQINLAAGLIRNAGVAIGGIEVPTGLTVEGGDPPFFVPSVELIYTSLFGPVYAALSSTSDRLKDVGDGLQEAADNLDSLGEALNTAGSGFHTLGTLLKEHGGELKRVAAGSP